ncbi:hypothetical protein BDB01DRAFT_770965 [Pilobolus umbonatus]|nr:hypothetical protein BDB01DRAFT_770965 [Pilobolus umbonatus]
MSPVRNNTMNMTTYYNNMHQNKVTAQATSARLGQFQTQLELARNFYDDDEFCPVHASNETYEDRDRIQQRLSPQSSPTITPHTMSPRISPKSKRAIPIINPNNMAPVSMPMKSVSPSLLNNQYWNYNNYNLRNGVVMKNNSHNNRSFNDILVQ